MIDRQSERLKAIQKIKEILIQYPDLEFIYSQTYNQEIDELDFLNAVSLFKILELISTKYIQNR